MIIVLAGISKWKSIRAANAKKLKRGKFVSTIRSLFQPEFLEVLIIRPDFHDGFKFPVSVNIAVLHIITKRQ